SRICMNTMAAVVNYSPPWWVNLFHRLPHFNLQFQLTSSDFRPEDSEYQKREFDFRQKSQFIPENFPEAVCFHNLFCKVQDAHRQKSNSIGCSLQVSESTSSLNETLQEGLVQLETVYSKHTDYLSIVQKLQGQLDELINLMVEVPFWSSTDLFLDHLASLTEQYDWYRWLGYLGLLLFDVIICLLVLVGLIRNSRSILISVCLLGVLTLVISWASLGLEFSVAVTASDFCVAPDSYITKVTRENVVINQDILQYYLKCSMGQTNPFQQKLSGSHKALVEMQDDVSELLRSAIREFPKTKSNLEEMQAVLNSTEVSLHHLTALVDCRSLHMDYVQALTGLCYDGVEGLIYLVLFSFVTALMFSSIVCSVPHTWQSKRSEEEDGDDTSATLGPRAPHDNLYRVHMPSLYSCGSSTYGSEASLPAAAHTVSNAPVTEYMSQNANFQTPRCENTPLIGRESPPPSVSAQAHLHKHT
ncbi:hypothetical protein cypCar_00023742, partial [Cyprinus carpio]